MATKRAAALLLTSLAAVCQAQTVTLLNLLSRPDIQAPTVYITTYDTSLTAPGYIFMTPNSPAASNFQYAPYIYNNQGHLVWTGYKDLIPGLTVYDENVCYYKGKPHISMTQFVGQTGGGAGGIGSFSQIMDETYSQVLAMRPTGTFAGQELTQDLHEFNVLGTAGSSALVTSYITFAHNVTYPACPGSPSTAFTKTGLFSEVSTDGLNTTLFQWNAIDHVDPTDAFVCPGDNNVGTGNVASDGFDFFHINAIDKDDNGDYLVSGRHTSTVYKVAGNNNIEGLAPGSVIWRLGGKHNNFTMTSTVAGTPNLEFSFQHHARFRPSINGISLWDNANDNDTPASANSSSGMSIELSTANGIYTATLIENYVSPGAQLDSSQGSHQFLPNGNHFLGLGSYPYIYEQTSTGETVWYANWGPLPLQSYRAFKYPWVGKPSIKEIALFSYAQNCTAPAAFYASWNGATEVASWKYFTSSTKTGTFSLAATAAHNGTFETFTFAPYNLYVYAIAYDDLGNNLGQTPTVGTFVPGAALAPSCNEYSCPVGTVYSTAAQAECAAPVAPITTSSSTTTSSTVKTSTTSKGTSPVRKTTKATSSPSSSSSPAKKDPKTTPSPSPSSSPVKGPKTTPSPSPSSAPVKKSPKTTPSPSPSPSSSPIRKGPKATPTPSPSPSSSPVRKGPKATPTPSPSPSSSQIKKVPATSPSPSPSPSSSPAKKAHKLRSTHTPHTAHGPHTPHTTHHHTKSTPSPSSTPLVKANQEFIN
ncbi:hypothetical protein MMC13_007992 [Lambiella insularis]|nr:hypothetical protein [Lambiella insularis]